MADAKIGGGNTNAVKKAGEAIAKSVNSENMKLTVDNSMPERKPQYYVYVHTVSQENMTIDRPPFARNLKFTGVDTKGETKIVCRFPDVYENRFLDPFTGQINVVKEDGRRIAMNVVCSANVSLDQDLVLTDDAASMNGINYLERGLF